MFNKSLLAVVLAALTIFTHAAPAPSPLEIVPRDDFPWQQFGTVNPGSDPNKPPQGQTNPEPPTSSSSATTNVGNVDPADPPTPPPSPSPSTNNTGSVEPPKENSGPENDPADEENHPHRPWWQDGGKKHHHYGGTDSETTD